MGFRERISHPPQYAVQVGRKVGVFLIEVGRSDVGSKEMLASHELITDHYRHGCSILPSKQAPRKKSSISKLASKSLPVSSARFFLGLVKARARIWSWGWDSGAFAALLARRDDDVSTCFCLTTAQHAQHSGTEGGSAVENQDKRQM